MLCSLAFLTYLDRICIMQVSGDIANDLRFSELTAEDTQRLEAAAADGYRSILSKADEENLRKKRLQDDPAARRAAAIKRLEQERARERLGYIFSAFLWGYMLFEIPGGWLGDTWGARRVIVRIVIWWSLFTALTGSVEMVVSWFASSPEPWMFVGTMVLIRFLFGLGEAGAYPNVGRALARWFPYRDRAAAQGAIWMASRFGGALAPLLVVGLKGWLGGWQAAFWFLGAVGIIWSCGFFLWFRDRPEEKKSVSAAECALIRAEEAAAGSIYDDHSHRSVPWLRLLTSSNLWATYLTAALVSYSWYFYVTFLPLYLKEQFGFNFDQSAYLTGLPLLVGGVSCLLGGRLSDYLISRTGNKRWGRSIFGLVGFTGAGICALCLTQATSPYQVIAIICIACAVQDLAIPCIWSACADIGGRYAGTVSGCMNTIGAVGGALSPLIAPRLANSPGLNLGFAVFEGWNLVFLVSGTACIVGGLMWLRIDATETLLTGKSNEECLMPNDERMTKAE